MISDRDQSQAGRLQESLSQQERLEQGRVGGFLRFSSVDTLLSGVLLTRYVAGRKNSLLSDAGGGQEKPSQCQTVSSLVDRPQAEESGGVWKQDQWDLLDDNTLVGEPSEYTIWRDILVQQKPSAANSSGAMKTSRTWTQA